MALFRSSFQPGVDTETNVRAVQAGDAAEMVSRLTNEAAAAVAAGESEIVDFNLAGAASGLLWQAWLTTTTDTGSETCETGIAQFVAAEAGNPAEAVLLLKQRIAEAIPSGGNMYKMEVAGAGDGPTYLAVALVSIVPG